MYSINNISLCPSFPRVHRCHLGPHMGSPTQTRKSSSQWQRFCLFQRDGLLTQNGLFGLSNNPSMIKPLFLDGSSGSIKTIWFRVRVAASEYKKDKKLVDVLGRCKEIRGGSALHITAMMKRPWQVQGQMVATSPLFLYWDKQILCSFYSELNSLKDDQWTNEPTDTFAISVPLITVCTVYSLCDIWVSVWFMWSPLVLER